MFERDQLLKAGRPAILFSGGKDSLLLLDEVLRARPDITIIHFYHRLRTEVQKVIEMRDLQVLSWKPAHQYFIPWGDDPVLVREYSFGNARLPVVTDIVQSVKECDVERLSLERTEYFDYPFDLTLWGYRKVDERHPIMAEPFPISFQLGPTQMLAPLYHWSDEDVLSEITKRKIPYEPFADELRMCAACKNRIANWDRETSLKFFQHRFGFQQEAA